jgi:zona occludens toxin
VAVAKTHAGNVDGLSQASTVIPVATKSDLSETLHIAGEVVLGGQRYVVVSDASGIARLESSGLFVGRGLTMVGNVDGQRVTTWSGQHVVPQKSAGIGVLK